MESAIEINAQESAEISIENAPIVAKLSSNEKESSNELESSVVEEIALENATNKAQIAIKKESKATEKSLDKIDVEMKEIETQESEDLDSQAKEIKSQVESEEIKKVEESSTEETKIEISEQKTEEKIIEASNLVKSPLDLSDKALRNLAEQFREWIPRRTVMAFGLKHEQVFTGEETYETLKKCLNWLENQQQVALDPFLYSQSQLELLASRLVHELMLFVPCVSQQRKCVQRNSPDGGMKSADGEQLTLGRKATIRRKRVLICDDNHTLYRLSKDALLQEILPTDFFRDFVQWMRDGERGVALKEGKLMFKTVSKSDRVFSKQSMVAWLQLNAGIEDPREIDSAWKLLKRRRVFKSVSFSSYFQFL